MQKDPVQSRSRRQVRGLGRLFRRQLGPVAPPSSSTFVKGSGMDLPISSDWGWRPDLWSTQVNDWTVAVAEPGMRVSGDASVFHDASVVHAGVVQAPGEALATPAPFAITLDVGAFDGSFLSLVIDLPPAGVSGLTRKHLVGVSLDLLRTSGQQVFARFNLRHGPNTEQLLREVPHAVGESSRQVVEFDLAYVEMNEKRVESAWIDLILQNPADSRTVVGDLVAYRRPRAEL